LGTLKEFRKKYERPDSENMRELHDVLFSGSPSRPPVALRRLKEMVAKDLPSKTRYLHPRLMPDGQAAAYEKARLKLAEGGAAAALKALHHIRTVSAHPALATATSSEGFISSSARIQAVMDLLHRIRSEKKRVLVFIEHRQMQYRFIEVMKSEFGLSRIDLINGETPIPRRQMIVNRFQSHLEDDKGFDILVLGPKAAGTGLTLTAATEVVHLSRWWNPAVEEQCNDRVHRIGQSKSVSVHVPMAVHALYREQSFDCLLHSLMNRKRRLASSALWPMGDTAEDAAELQEMMSDKAASDVEQPLQAAMIALFSRDGMPMPAAEADGGIRFS
jgi:SNF2 family DNA or RNA helicase